FRSYIEAPVLSHISVDYGNLDVYDVDPVSIPDATSKRPVVVYGKWKGNPDGVLKLTGESANGAYSFSVNVGAQPIRPENTALRYLWAHNRVRFIEDGMIGNYGNQRGATTDEQRDITAIGVKYNILTKYTSFIAVDTVVSVSKQLTKKEEEQKPKQDSLLHSQQPVTEPLRIDSTRANKKVIRSAVEFISAEQQSTLNTTPPPAGTATGRAKKAVRAEGKGSAGSAAAAPSKTKEVVVSANRIVDDKKVGVSENVSGESTQRTTRESALQVATTPAGVATSGGGFTVRGSRPTDTEIRIDGMDVTDPVTGGVGSGFYAPKNITGDTVIARSISTKQNARDAGTTGTDSILVNKLRATGNTNQNEMRADSIASQQIRNSQKIWTDSLYANKFKPSGNIQVDTVNARTVHISQTLRADSVRARAGTIPTNQSAPQTTGTIPQTTSQSSPNSARTPQQVVVSATDSKPSSGGFLGLFGGSSTSGDNSADEANALEPEKAPPKLFIGPVAGYGFGVNGISDVDVAGISGSIAPRGGGFYYGIATEFLIGNPKTSKSSLIIDLMYESTSGTSSFIADGINAFRAQDGSSTTATATVANELRIRRFMIRPLYRFNLGNTPIGFVIGGTLGINAGSALTSTAALPDGILWQPNGAAKQTTEQTFRSISVAISAGIQYEIILKRFSIIPSVIYDVPLGGLSEAVPLRQGVLRAGVAVRFAVGSVF
ncbi:MAG: hypothetical protein JNL32_04540, partial [Candidatus Kapabacteria bacterium]|nr:hypothetical protein [Candidatus Kapabacteria bacterium]